MSPAIVSTRRRVPRETETIVSVSAAPGEAESRARVVSSSIESSSGSGDRVGGPPKDRELAPHVCGDLAIQIPVVRVALDRSPRLLDRSVDLAEALVNHANGGGVKAAGAPALLEDPGQVGHP